MTSSGGTPPPLEPTVTPPDDDVAPGDFDRAGSTASFVPEHDRSGVFEDSGVARRTTSPAGAASGAGMPRREASARRILNWLAVGLAAVSLSTGLLHYLHYRRVGNAVTALLPRETVAYVRLGHAAAVEERLHNLDLWSNTRPVRSLVQDEKDIFLDLALYDLNINRRLLDALEEGTAGVHVALIESVPSGSFDIVVVLEVVDRAAYEELESRVLSTFDSAGEVGGVLVKRHRGGGRSLWAATVDGLAIFCAGSIDGISAVLENRERSPNRTLNDSEAFRSAWFADKSPPDVFAFVRGDFLEAYLGANFPQSTTAATLVAIGRLFDSSLLAAGLAIDLNHGRDRTRVAISTPTSGMTALAEETGVDKKRTLAAVPSTATLAVAMTVRSPAALFARVRPWILRAAGHALAVDEAELDSELNRIQAETGRLLARDVWPQLAGELAVALVPKPKRGFDFLVVGRAHEPEALVQSLADLGRAWLDGEGSGATTRVTYTQGSYRFEGPSGARSCLAVTGDFVLFGSSCDVVATARTAEQTGDGLAELPSVAEALAELPPRNTMILVGRLREVMALAGVSKRIASLVDDQFLLTTSVTIGSEVAEVALNLSPLSVGLLAAADHNEVARPELCDKLFSQVCPTGPSDRACEKYGVRLKSMTAETCGRAIQALHALDEQIHAASL